MNTDAKEEKIESLQEMIATAEQTINSARQMLSNLQGQEGGGEIKPSASFDSLPTASGTNGEKVIFGNFDGQVMLGEDNRQYPVPANYASKSKLIEGDKLKLTITTDSNFLYKQVGPAQRKYLIGIVQKDERGNFVIQTEEKIYKVLLAAATYFKIEFGDEVTIVVPKDTPSEWGAIENVIKKASESESLAASANTPTPPPAPTTEPVEESEPEEEDGKDKPTAIEKLEQEMEEERKSQESKDEDEDDSNESDDSILDEWTPDIEKIKAEASKPVKE